MFDHTTQNKQLTFPRYENKYSLSSGGRSGSLGADFSHLLRREILGVRPHSVFRIDDSRMYWVLEKAGVLIKLLYVSCMSCLRIWSPTAFFSLPGALVIQPPFLVAWSPSYVCWTHLRSKADSVEDVELDAWDLELSLLSQLNLKRFSLCMPYTDLDSNSLSVPVLW